MEAQETIALLVPNSSSVFGTTPFSHTSTFSSKATILPHGPQLVNREPHLEKAAASVYWRPKVLGLPPVSSMAAVYNAIHSISSKNISYL